MAPTNSKLKLACCSTQLQSPVPIPEKHHNKARNNDLALQKISSKLTLLLRTRKKQQHVKRTAVLGLNSAWVLQAFLSGHSTAFDLSRLSEEFVM